MKAVSKRKCLSEEIVSANSNIGINVGEMDPEPFWDTAMNPETRKIVQVTVEDAEAADQMLTLCMGSEVKDRRDFIIENAISAIVDV